MELSESLRALFGAQQIDALAAAMQSASRWLIAMLAVTAALEYATGGNLRRYRTSSFLNDLVYAVFYRGGLYILFIYLPLLSLLSPRYSLNLVSDLPLPLTAIVYLVCSEFLMYWIHRLQHASPLFWRFHKIHHAQTCLTFVTQSRFHVVDQLVNHLFVAIPLMLLLGVSPVQWFPLMVLGELILMLEHADLPWRFGPFGRLIVSPVFHAIHHSVLPEHHNRNFGQILSVWDYMFGTATEGPRPRTFGLTGWAIPQSFLSELTAPFRQTDEQSGPYAQPLRPVRGAPEDNPG